MNQGPSSATITEQDHESMAAWARNCLNSIHRPPIGAEFMARCYLDLARQLEEARNQASATAADLGEALRRLDREHVLELGRDELLAEQPRQ